MTAERFVVIAPQGLGDSLEATPLLAALRAARPNAYVEAIVLRAAAKTLFLGLPGLVDRVRYLPYWERGALAFVSAAARLPFSRRADATFLTYPAARAPYAALQALVPARRHYLHDYPEVRHISSRLPIAHVVAIEPKHNVLRNMDLLASAGIEADVPREYTVPTDWMDDAPRNGHRVVVHVGSIAHDGFDLRRWPEASFAELVRRLTVHGLDVQLLSGPDERDATERIRAAIPAARIVSGPLPEMARLISTAGAVVANDNGIAHLAAGLRIPVISLFGPTPLLHAPFGASSTPIRPSDCPPCFDPLRKGVGCVRNIDYRCLKVDLSVDVAERAALEALGADHSETIASIR